MIALDNGAPPINNYSINNYYTTIVSNSFSPTITTPYYLTIYPPHYMRTQAVNTTYSLFNLGQNHQLAIAPQEAKAYMALKYSFDDTVSARYLTCIGMVELNTHINYYTTSPLFSLLNNANYEFYSWNTYVCNTSYYIDILPGTTRVGMEYDLKDTHSTLDLSLRINTMVPGYIGWMGSFTTNLGWYH